MGARAGPVPSEPCETASAAGKARLEVVMGAGLVMVGRARLQVVVRVKGVLMEVVAQNGQDSSDSPDRTARAAQLGQHSLDRAGIWVVAGLSRGS